MSDDRRSVLERKENCPVCDDWFHSQNDVKSIKLTGKCLQCYDPDWAEKKREADFYDY